MNESTTQFKYVPLRRSGIDSLDEAMYAASCFAANSEYDRTVTVLIAIDKSRDEHYAVLDGRLDSYRDNFTGTDWEAVYYITAPVRRG